MRKDYTIIKLMNHNGFISYNKTIAKKLGINEAILFGELCNIFEYFNCEEFYFEQSRIENDTALSVFQIRKSTDILIKNGLISVIKKGIPCRNYYTINTDTLIALLNEEEKTETETEKKDIPDCENSQTRCLKIKHKMFKNYTSCCEETASLFKEITEENKKEIRNISAKADKTKAKPKINTEAQQVLLDNLCEADSKIFDDCVTTLFDFRKKQDIKFSRRAEQLAEWKYEFANYAKQSDREAVELLATLKWALNNNYWQKILYLPKNFIANYEKLFMQAKLDKQQYTSGGQRYREDYTDAERMAESDNDRIDGVF